jgi:pSer/pThr/pTyr-binding forkhead associated (FHA) protein
MARLILKFQGALIKEYEIDQPSTRIGRREGNDIQIDNLAVSGSHAKVQKVNDSYIIVDLKSTNGTFVNRKKIVQAKLNHMDEITIGKHTLIFEEEKQPSQKAPEPLKPIAEPLKETAGPKEESQKETAATPPTGKLGRFRFLGTGEPREVILEKKLTIIGRRDDADIRLKGPFAPKMAAYINRKPSGYSILPEDKVRVKVNGELVTSQTDLADGDVIDVGSLKIEFKEG